MTSPAHCFDTLAGDPCWHAFTAEDQRKVDAFFQRWQLRPGDRVLEPGCGSGRLTALLAEQVGPTGRVVAFDSSPEFMRQAAARGMPAHVTLHTAAAETLSLETASFDQVICFNVFPHLVPHDVLTARLAAALRPGGVFWIAHTGSRGFINGIHQRGPACIHDHLLPEPGALVPMLHAAGLDEVTIEDGTDCFLARAVRRA